MGSHRIVLVPILPGIARVGHARKPPFEDDPGVVRQSLTGLLWAPEPETLSLS